MANKRHTTKNNINAGLVDIEISGDSRQVDKRLEDLERAFDDMIITFDFLGIKVYNILKSRAASRFAQEGDDVSGPWAELREYTQEERLRGGFGPAHPINVRTGEMKRQILESGPDAVPVAWGGILWFPARGGTPEVQQKIQTAQIGNTTGRKTVPRPVLGVNIQDLELVLVALGLHIQQYQTLGGGRIFR